MARRTPRPPHTERGHHPTEVLDFRPEQGIVRLHDQRLVLLSAVAMGLLRKELIDTLGIVDARRLFLRFGYADGYHDAVSLRNRWRWADPLDGLSAGAELQRLEGIVRTESTRMTYDCASGRFEQELAWHDSYVAEHHLHHYGRSAAPVCWSLVGYASGYASACLRQEIYFRESACLATGAGRCIVIGKDAASWNEELEALRDDFHGAALGAEVERLRDIVNRRLRALQRREQLVAERERALNGLPERVARLAESRQFVAGSAVMRDVLELAARVAPLETTVLVQGESGTGKEFIVRMIHDESPRAAGPLVSVNCAALTETLLESELFGHVRGAFTGAVRDKAGLFEVAGGGTLFLDEIGDVTPAVQAKLLRALQEREIRRVGAERTIKVDARIVAATNRDLRAAVAAGDFREDLYYRLAVFVITVPPLRERRDDIPLLVDRFVRRAATRLGKKVEAVVPEAMSGLIEYQWPGNVRELEHAVERAVILARGTNIRRSDLSSALPLDADRLVRDGVSMRERERAAIAAALQRTGGNRKATAAAMKFSTVTLWRRMKQYGLL